MKTAESFANGIGLPQAVYINMCREFQLDAFKAGMVKAAGIANDYTTRKLPNNDITAGWYVKACNDSK